jgi:predicted DNA-binding transcriptional regulator AlpA
MSAPSAYLSTERAAELLGLAPATLVKWRRLRRGPPFARLGRRIVYSEKTLRAWAEMHAVSPAQDRRRA